MVDRRKSQVGDRLTGAQMRVFEYLKGFYKEYGFFPSVREIADTFGVNVKSIGDHLKAIEKKGWAKRKRHPRTGKAIARQFVITTFKEDKNESV